MDEQSEVRVIMNCAVSEKFFNSVTQSCPTFDSKYSDYTIVIISSSRSMSLVLESVQANSICRNVVYKTDKLGYYTYFAEGFTILGFFFSFPDGFVCVLTVSPLH